MRRFFFFILLALPSLASAQTVYLKPSEALKVIFSDSKAIVAEDKTLTLDQKAKIEKKIGGKLSKDVWKFFVAKTGDRIDGYALIDNEIGKTDPITFLTAMTPQGTVKGVEVLVYREPVGSEVHEKIFLKQYIGKKETDPIRTGQDINNISGATLSSRAMSVGVKRALVLWNELYGHK